MSDVAALTTPAQIDGFRILVLVKSMEIYLLHGMQSTRAATPANMRKMATEYTGVEYPRSRRGLILAYNGLIDWHNVRVLAGASTHDVEVASA